MKPNFNTIDIKNVATSEYAGNNESNWTTSEL